VFITVTTDTAVLRVVEVSNTLVDAVEVKSTVVAAVAILKHEHPLDIALSAYDRTNDGMAGCTSLLAGSKSRFLAGLEPFE
jgi:hypothetical protein